MEKRGAIVRVPLPIPCLQAVSGTPDGFPFPAVLEPSEREGSEGSQSSPEYCCRLACRGAV